MNVNDEYKQALNHLSMMIDSMLNPVEKETGFILIVKRSDEPDCLDIACNVTNEGRTEILAEALELSKKND